MAEQKVNEQKGVKGGELLFCGCTHWDAIGRRKVSPEHNLISPSRLRPLVGVNICFVAAGCASCHCVALDTEGRCYTWGRNEKGQLGHGDKITRDRPTVVSELSKHKIIRAGSGRSHTVVVTDDGLSFSFGWNKHGQLGTGSIRNEIEHSPVRCLLSEAKTTSCGADFTVWLTSVEGSSILTAGLPQYGQLGHGTDNEHNTKDSSVRLVYEPQPKPKAIAAFSGETIVKVACGSNHTVAVDTNGFVYTWGFGGYGRLGHREQKDEWVPRRVDGFTRQNVLPPDAVLSAGSLNSSCTAGGGQLYMWGKIKVTGDDWMYPKAQMDLSGWNLRCMDSGYMHHFVGADSSCISWGHAQSGELGYGPNAQKSSAVPKKVDILDGMHVLSVACGFSHSMIVVDRANVGDKLDQLEVYDGKISEEGPDNETSVTEKAPPKKATRKLAAAAKSKKRMKPSNDSSSDSGGGGDDENGHSDDDSEEGSNGQKAAAAGNGKKGGSKSTRGRKAAATGRGGSKVGPNIKKSPSDKPKGSGKRGRPRKTTQ